jgi:hypothetical protein
MLKAETPATSEKTPQIGRNQDDTAETPATWAGASTWAIFCPFAPYNLAAAAGDGVVVTVDCTLQGSATGVVVMTGAVVIGPGVVVTVVATSVVCTLQGSAPEVVITGVVVTVVSTAVV